MCLKCTHVNFASVKGKLARWDQEISPDRPDRPLGPTEPPLQWVPWLFTGEYCGRDMNLTTHFCRALRLEINGAVPLLPLYAFVAWTETALPFRCTLQCDCIDTIKVRFVYILIFCCLH